MKKLLALPLPILIAAGFLLLGAGVTFGAIYIGGGGAIQLQKGLVGHWKFDDNAKDATPRATNGSVQGGAALTTDRKGQSNKAYTFDGTGDYIDYGDPADGHFDFGTGDFAVAFWINKTNVPAGISNQRPFSKGAVASSVAGYAFFGSQLADGLSFALSNGNGGGDGVDRIIISSAAVTLGNWHHVVGQRNGNSQELYVDGVLASSNAPPAGSLSTDKSVLLGAVNSPAELFFAGKLDDVRIYNRALSTAEITALYDQYDPGVRVADTQKGLVGNWKMDGNAKDSTPNQNNGTVTGATLTTDRKGQTNKAYSFDGVNNNVQVADSANLNFGTGDFTATAWIYPTKNSPANQEFSFISKAVNTTSPGWWLETHTWSISGDQIKVASYFGKTDSYTSVGAFTTTLNQWHHVALVRSGTNVKLYGDGVEKVNTTNADLGLSINNADALYIGGKTGHNNGFYGGSIGDVRVYNRALSPTEITALYDSYNPVLQVSNLQKGLVGNWKMDGNAKDSTPNENNGTVTGATLTTDRKGQSNKAYSFNGTTAFIGLGDALDGTFAGADKKFSISAWIKPASTMTNNNILSKAADSRCSENQRQFYLALGASSRLNFSISALTGSFARQIAGTTSITDISKWYHVVIAYDGSIDTNDGLDRVAMYIDGVAESTSLTVTAGTLGDIADGTAHFGVGNILNSSGSNCGTDAFNGLIDDVRVYNRALSAAEVTVLYDSYQ